MTLNQTDDGWMVLNNKGQPMHNKPFKSQQAAQKFLDRINQVQDARRARDSRSRVKA